jgi:multidrug efflux pump subunit AcrB
VDPQRLHSCKVKLTQLIESTGNVLWVSPSRHLRLAPGGLVETPNQRLECSTSSRSTPPDQPANVAVKGARTPPLRIDDVATVAEDHQPLIGDASRDGTPSLMLVVERIPRRQQGPRDPRRR